MIGIVIVSHSARLAEGVRELASQMTQGKVPIAIAGGIDAPDNPIGTDANRVVQAIQEVFSDDGVIVLMDLGSALLSAEMALEFLPEEQRERIYLLDAPLVEGAVAAAAQAAATGDIQAAIAEARQALQAKQVQLQTAGPDSTLPESGPAVSAAGQEIRLTVRNRLGLHARPAAQFVATAGRFQAEITVTNLTRGAGPVSAKSINQLATLGVRQNHEIAITAAGPDAGEALAALAELVENNFGEDDTTAEAASAAPPPVQAAEVKAGELAGVAASPGIAIGPAFLYRAAVIKVETRQIDDPQAEQGRLRQAIEAAKQEIDLLKRQAESQISRYEAGIFEAHRLVLEDPALVDAALGFIAEAHINAEAAWQKAVEAIISSYQALDDPYLQARQTDVADVGQRVLKHLTGTTPAKPALDTPAIIIADDLSPSDTMQLDPDKVLGICTALGSATAHSAILARALGIPAVVGVGPAIWQIKDGTVVALDGQQGKVWPAPDEQTRRDLQARRDRWRSDWALLKASAQQPAITTDGKRVEVAANIGAATEIKNALRHGAEGVGLFRTELLFINRTAPPDEEEQVAIYRQAADLLGRRPLIIRTLDIGGDKPLPYLNLPPEENPFLGWRGIRLCLGQPELFKTQLRAILRASFNRQIKIMFPMVSTVDEIRAARQLLAEVQADLRASGIPFDEGMQIGIMVETPAAVAQADLLAAEVDFFSIGTNDLSQYTMAADRTNARVSALTNPFHPAVLRMIQQTIKAGHKAGIWVGMCGEFAGNPLAAPLLLGLELDEFSMNAPAIPQVKQIIRRLSLRKARQIARKALKLDSAQAVEAFLKSSLPSG